MNKKSLQIGCVTLLALTALIAGCGKSLQKKITGVWVIDEGEDLFAMMGDEAQKQPPQFVLEFSAAGVFQSTVTSSGFTQVKQGRWFFMEGQGDVCRLRVSINSSNPEIDPDIVLTEVRFVDEKTIELVPPNMDVIKHKMRFRKQE